MTGRHNRKRLADVLEAIDTPRIWREAHTTIRCPTAWYSTPSESAVLTEPLTEPISPSGT